MTAETPTTCQTTTCGRTITPRTDIHETGDEYVVQADMPGVAPQNVDIQFENGELTVHGRRTTTQAGRERVMQESTIDGYRRSFRLAEHIASDRIDATMNGGVLTLKLPKTDAVKPRKIAVKF
jgi:HSP20 family protein